jgi:streptogramin lyase
MSNATNLALLGLSSFGNAGNVLTSTGETTAPAFSANSVGVREIRVVNQVLSRLGIDKSTGNVSVSGLPDISELDVPSWVNAGHISDWSTLQYYLSAVAATNTSPASAGFVEYLSVVQAYNKGMVLAPNGKMYTAPHTGSGVTYGLIIDPSNNTISSYIATLAGLGSGLDVYYGSVLGSNGKIYMVPDRATVGAFVDPSNNIFSTFGTLPAFGVGTNAFAYAISAPNGKIYLIPQNSTIGRTIDPNTNTFGTYPSSSWSGGLSYHSTASLAPNGKIYVFPSLSTLVVKIDPSNDSTTVILSNVTNIAGSVLAPNGNIYLIPSTSSQKIIKFDPASETVSTIAATNTGGGVGCLLPNGKIFYAGYSNTVASVFDPSNETIQTICTITGSPATYAGWNLAPNGKVYGLPFSTSNIICINFLNKNNWNLNVATNPMFNKN